jgi:hypothetical protein
MELENKNHFSIKVCPPKIILSLIFFIKNNSFFKFIKKLMYLTYNICQMHQFFNKSKKWFFTDNNDWSIEVIYRLMLIENHLYQYFHFWPSHFENNFMLWSPHYNIKLNKYSNIYVIVINILSKNILSLIKI